MDRRRSVYSEASDDDGTSTSTTTVAVRSDFSPLKPDYTSKAVQEALEHLASIDLIELCNEAKVEQCRATRDLRSCGRYVRHVLNSCGHASLCAECSQRCDICPICRLPIPKHENRLRLRLYYECIEAGLISKKFDERFQDKEDGEKQPNGDVERLYSFFDVAMESNLVSLICHYITDVCMDETAVSSNPVIAFLLDEVVVKNWCKRTFKNIINKVRRIYSLQIEEMNKMLTVLLKFSAHLTGICNVLEVLESSLKGTLSAEFHDVHDLQESILMTKQHMEIMMWGVRHQFLENVRSRHNSLASWCSLVSERKAAAIRRAWPDTINNSSEPSVQDGTLFIEDALLNLEMEQVYTPETEEEILVATLHKDGASSISRSKIVELSGTYPFENVRAATDILFLHGSSDLVVAKRAIFLYYMFDRHWTQPDENWRHIVDDFAATFGITRHSLLESLTFYLLDDHVNEAMQEACRLLPEISSPGTHPKIAQVLLERQNPDAALMVLRWSGRDGGAILGSLAEAVTGVRVRVESGLLTEAFMYQRMLCMKVKDKNVKQGLYRNPSKDSNDVLQSWVVWMDALVTEICYLCIRRKLVDRMVDLPWNSDEEKYLHKSLLDYAMENPSTTIGSLLVVFYLKRYRYIEAYQADRVLKSVEQEHISNNSVGEEIIFRMRSSSHWRAGLVDKCVELLPKVQQQQLKTGNLSEFGTSPGEDINMPTIPDVPNVQEYGSSSLLIPSSTDSSVIFQLGHATPSLKLTGLENPFSQGGIVNKFHFDLNNASVRPLANAEQGHKSQMGINKNFKFDGFSTPGKRRVNPIAASSLKEFGKSSSRMMNSHLQGNSPDEASPESQVNGLIKQLQNSSTPYSRRVADNNNNYKVATAVSKWSFFNDSTPDRNSNLSDSQTTFENRPWTLASTNDDRMDVSWSNGNKSFGTEEANANGAPRWRSDESDDNEHESPDRIPQVASHTTPMRGIRRSRFARN